MESLLRAMREDVIQERYGTSSPKLGVTYLTQLRGEGNIDSRKIRGYTEDYLKLLQRQVDLVGQLGQQNQMGPSISAPQSEPTDFGKWDKANGKWTIKMPATTVGVLMSITPKNRVQLKTYPLEDIDFMRDLIYGEKGNTTTIITADYPGYDLPLYKSFTKSLS